MKFDSQLDILDKVIAKHAGTRLRGSVFDEALKVKLSFIRAARRVDRSSLLAPLGIPAVSNKALQRSVTNYTIGLIGGASNRLPTQWLEKIDRRANEFLTAQEQGVIAEKIDEAFISNIETLNRLFKIHARFPKKLEPEKERLRVAFDFLGRLKKISLYEFAADLDAVPRQSDFNLNYGALRSYIKHRGVSVFDDAQPSTVQAFNDIADTFLLPDEKAFLDEAFHMPVVGAPQLSPVAK